MNNEDIYWFNRAKQYAEVAYHLFEGDDVAGYLFESLRQDQFVDKNDEWIYEKELKDES